MPLFFTLDAIRSGNEEDHVYALPEVYSLTNVRKGVRLTRRILREEERVVEEALVLIDALDGISNIVDVEPCFLRIHVEVKSQREVDEAALRTPPVLAIVRSGSFVQVTAGPESEVAAHKMREQIPSP